jgi:hypothetical protein
MVEAPARLSAQYSAAPLTAWLAYANFFAPFDLDDPAFVNDNLDGTVADIPGSFRNLAQRDFQRRMLGRFFDHAHNCHRAPDVRVKICGRDGSRCKRTTEILINAQVSFDWHNRTI